MAATADHISGGRFGLNVVAGWYAKELAMFGVTQREHDDRYAVADEWTVDPQAAVDDHRHVRLPRPPTSTIPVGVLGAQAAADAHIR